MDDMTKQEIEDELVHKREVLRALRQRLRPLEIQEAKKGDSTPPEIVTEIKYIVDRMGKLEEDIALLKTRAAEDRISIEEVEYRAALANAWSANRPTIAGRINVELVRLRLGIKPGRSEEIERYMRDILADEAFNNIKKKLFDVYRYDCFVREGYNTKYCFLVENIDLLFGNPDNESLVFLAKSIWIDFDKTVSLLLAKIPFGFPKLVSSIVPGDERILGHGFRVISSVIFQNTDIDISTVTKSGIRCYSPEFRDRLLNIANIEETDADYPLFERFLHTLEFEIKKRENLADVDRSIDV